MKNPLTSITLALSGLALAAGFVVGYEFSLGKKTAQTVIIHNIPEFFSVDAQGRHFNKMNLINSEDDLLRMFQCKDSSNPFCIGILSEYNQVLENISKCNDYTCD